MRTDATASKYWKALFTGKQTDIPLVENSF